MQQTETYKLNKPGVDDPIAIAPLNENMDRLEAALAAETAARQSADTAETKARTAADTAETKARTAADTALDARVTALDGRVKTIEIHKIAVGTYSGSAMSGKTVDVGFKPLFVVICGINGVNCGIVTRSTACMDGTLLLAKIADKGFTLGNGYALSSSISTYNYVAFA